MGKWNPPCLLTGSSKDWKHRYGHFGQRQPANGSIGSPCTDLCAEALSVHIWLTNWCFPPSPLSSIQKIYLLFPFSTCPLWDKNNEQEEGWQLEKSSEKQKAWANSQQPPSPDTSHMTVMIPPLLQRLLIPKQRRQRTLLPRILSAFCMLFGWREKGLHIIMQRMH